MRPKPTVLDISEFPPEEGAEYFRRIAVRAGHYARLSTDQSAKQTYAKLSEHCRRIVEKVEAGAEGTASGPMSAQRSPADRSILRLARYLARIAEALALARKTSNATERSKLVAVAEAWSARARRLASHLAGPKHTAAQK